MATSSHPMRDWAAAPEAAEIFKANGTWMVRWLSGDGKRQVLKLFGTDTLPTAFTCGAPAEEVLDRLRKVPSNQRVHFSVRPN